MKNSNDNLAKIAMNKSLLKEFHNNENDRIVYLKDGDEFQIQIFNPYQYVIGVSFTFNSDNIDNSKLLVLKPGERVWLDRYLNENKKMRFSTYEVGNSNEVKKAIEKNGIVNIYFYKEKEQNDIIYIYNTYTSAKTWDPTPSWYNYEITCDNNKLTSSVDNINANIDSSKLGISTVSTALGSITDDCLSVSSATTYTTFANTIPNGTNSCLNKNNASRSMSKKSIETGRVDKGSYSSQQFNNYYGDFENYWFKKETIKILPDSQKQISVSDLNKKYCYNCGKKIKKEFKFCPSCGAAQ